MHWFRFQLPTPLNIITEMQRSVIMACLCATGAYRDTKNLYQDVEDE